MFGCSWCKILCDVLFDVNLLCCVKFEGDFIADFNFAVVISAVDKTLGRNLGWEVVFDILVLTEVTIFEFEVLGQDFALKIQRKFDLILILEIKLLNIRWCYNSISSKFRVSYPNVLYWVETKSSNWFE